MALLIYRVAGREQLLFDSIEAAYIQDSLNVPDLRGENTGVT